MLPSVAHLRNISINYVIYRLYTRVMTIYRLNIFLILNGIFFAEKWLNTDIRSFLAPDFWNGMEWNGMEWNGMEWNRIHRFQTEYFWLKSGKSRTFGPS